MQPPEALRNKEPPLLALPLFFLLILLALVLHPSQTFHITI